MLRRGLYVLLAANLLLMGHNMLKEALAGSGAPVASENGDINGDQRIDIADPVALLEHLFLGGPAPAAIAQGSQSALEARVAALEAVLQGFSRQGDTVTIEGANLQLVNGLGSTGSENGVGNLIVGYNEPRTGNEDPPVVDNARTGSHNIVLGRRNNYTSHGALVTGSVNASNAPFANVLGGLFRVANEDWELVGGVTEEQQKALSYVRFVQDDGAGNAVDTVRIEGANLQIVNGLGATNGRPENTDDFGSGITNGVGNLIIGYQEPRIPSKGPNLRTGSHNVVIGTFHNYTSFAGLLSGSQNEINASHAACIGGAKNVANGIWSFIGGGSVNRT